MKYWHYILVVFFALSSISVQAQSFAPTQSSAEKDTTPSSQDIFSQTSSSSFKAKTEETSSDAVQNIQDAFFNTKNSPNKDKSVDPFAIMSRAQSGTTDEAKKTDEAPKKRQKDSLPPVEEDEDIFVPRNEISEHIYTPTVDGSQRGAQSFVLMDKNGNVKKVTNIFLFYDQFDIYRGFASYTTCNVRFNIISNLDRKLSQLDVKLVWPDISTSLSFSEVPPNTQLYYNYTLLGDGCYTMDKAPNIVVNRCRAKGMTSAECAAKIKWVAK